jgi:hypothetical protein
VGLEASIQTKEKEAFLLLVGFCPLHYVRFSFQFQFVDKEMGTSLLVGVGLLQLVKFRLQIPARKRNCFASWFHFS